MVASLSKELAFRKEYLDTEQVATIYFGGGTPSLLETENLRLLIDTCREHFGISAEAEITIEANPDDITDERLFDWKDIGINRLSIGIQSFFDEDLQWMNRAHNASQAIESLKSALFQFSDISIDLIYGTPGLANNRWKENVDRAVDLGIPHLSCYALTVEPSTSLEKMIRLHRSNDINPDKQSEQFLLLMEWMGSAGYEHYEISNFAKPGWRSRHNSSYWKGEKYLGIGPSAHSFDGKSRQWNMANNAAYIRSLMAGELNFEKEILTGTQRINEYIMTSIRTMEGLDLQKLEQFRHGAAEIVKSRSQKFIDDKKIVLQNDRIMLTRKGKLFADGIAADLFF